MQSAEQQVLKLFKSLDKEVVFTSSASEANNLSIVGIAQKYPDRPKRIITTKLEHASVLNTVEYLKRMYDFEIEYVENDDNGQIDLIDLRRLLDKGALLVSITAVNSEVGIKQDLKSIKRILKDYPQTFLHVDGTQAVGKIPVDLTDIALFTCSAHKFFGLKGIGCLIKDKKVILEPLIHGGKSQSIYRSGTPAVSLIVSFAKALRLALENLDEKYQHVEKLSLLLKKELSTYPNIKINSNTFCIPHILNISIKGIKPETLIHSLEQYDCYVSTNTACSKDISSSKTLVAMHQPSQICTSSIRISLSYMTTENEIREFLKIFQKSYDALNFRNEEN